MSDIWNILGIGIATALLLLAATLAGGAARAHDWYPAECCGGYDCGPATMTTVAGATYYRDRFGKALDQLPGKVPPFVSEVTVTYTAGPSIGKSETVIVPDDFPRRESKDGRVHACVVLGNLRCLFIPPAM